MYYENRITKFINSGAIMFIGKMRVYQKCMSIKDGSYVYSSVVWKDKLYSHLGISTLGSTIFPVWAPDRFVVGTKLKTKAANRGWGWGCWCGVKRVEGPPPCLSAQASPCQYSLILLLLN